MASILFPVEITKAQYEDWADPRIGVFIKLFLHCQEQKIGAKMYCGWGTLGLMFCADRVAFNNLLDFDWDGTEEDSRRVIPAVVGRTLTLSLGAAVAVA